MRFWDSSAIVPILVEEPLSRLIKQTYIADPSMMVWWGTEVECSSAIARLERSRQISAPGAALARDLLKFLRRTWDVVPADQPIKDKANQLVRSHPLRAADALQLAAAFAGAGNQPSTLAFVTLDRRLAEAAHGEGFALAIPF